MSEVTMCGGGTTKYENDVELTQDQMMKSDESEAQSAYQLAWIKNMNTRLTAVEVP